MPDRTVKDIKVGDWIRFQRNGVLVVGVVAYVRPKSSWDSTPILWTHEHGEVTAEIVEVRRA